MATERSNQSQSQGKSRSKPGTQASDGDLMGTTVDGVEVEASFDDDAGDLSADADDSSNSDSDESRGSRGNFANDPERAREAGRKGGKH